MNDGSTDLAQFRRSGGKAHHLARLVGDPLISPLHTLAYYRKLAAHFAAAGTDQDAAWRRCRILHACSCPWVMHCGGGPGPDTFDSVGALEAWVEHGVAPDNMIAAHRNGGKTDRTRPLCAYPQKATYDGKGDSNDAASFSCR